MIYTIVTRREYDGEETVVIRRREDAAYLALGNAVYAAAEIQGKLDTVAAHVAMARIRSWTKRHPIEPIRIGHYRVTISP